MRTPYLFILLSFISCGLDSSIDYDQETLTYSRPRVGSKVDSELEQLKKDILIPNCIECHKWVEHEGIFNRIKPGSPEESILYTDIANDSMPMWPYDLLTSEQKKRIYDYIKNLKE